MNYDGPSFYKKREDRKEKTPLEHLEKESRFRSRYFRSKHIPQSLQNLEGWKKEKGNTELLAELEGRLKKEKADYLLFSAYLSEEIEAEELANQQQAQEKEKIKLVKKKAKPDLKKPNTGLHRSLSKIITEDKNNIKK